MPLEELPARHPSSGDGLFLWFTAAFEAATLKSDALLLTVFSEVPLRSASCLETIRERIDRIMYSTRGLILVVALSAISVALLWLTSIPLGIPSEWTWERISADGAESEIVLGIIQAGIAGIVYVLVAWLGARRIGTCSRLEVVGWLLGISIVGCGWMLAVQEAPRSGWRMSKAAFVLYYPGSSGYFHKARYEMPDSVEFLRDYEDLMSEGDVLHVGTHPPGLFLIYRSLIDLLDDRPALSQSIAITAPESTAEAFAIIDELEQRSGKELTTADRAVIWLATILTQTCCVLAVVPIFLLIRQSCSRETSWQTAVFWPLLPALAIFIPKSDVLFVLPATLLIWSWLCATRHQSFFIGSIAGAIGWGGLFCSLAFLPVGLIAFVASLLAAIKPQENDDHHEEAIKTNGLPTAVVRSLWKPLLGGIIAVAGLTLVVSLLCEMNLLRVWVYNYHNHAGFYARFTRTVWMWWLVNPLELIFAVGVPVMFLAARTIRKYGTSWRIVQQRPLLASFLSVWTLLWLSGKNSGEAARLWIPLFPALLAVSASESDGSPESISNENSNGESQWLILLACQEIVCLATVLRVSGFHF